MFKPKPRRKIYEEDYEELPIRNRPFKLKERAPIETEKLKEEAPSPAAGEAIRDDEGLQRAYEQGDAYPHGDTLYIAGSHTAKDWYDDVTKIPFWGDLHNATRYQQADKALKANPNIKKVVGHSLGGAVALQLQRDHPNLTSRTYGAPVWDPLGEDGKVERYRNWGDPVSIFDRSTNKSVKANPFDSYSLTHDYSNIASKFKSGGSQNAYGWQNPDGTTSLHQ